MFLFRLALRLGRTVRELEESISYVELREWVQFSAFDPFDERRAEMRHASLMALLANVNRNKKKRPKPYTPKEFMLFGEPDDAPPPRRETRTPVKFDPNLLTYFFVMSKRS